jgi:TetR/AcrR family transcriptional regulator
MNAIAGIEMSFKKKIEHLIDVFMEQSLTYPYMDVYMVTRMNDDVEKQNEIIADIRKTDKLKLFMKEIDEEINKGNLRDTTAIQFFMNLMSLMTYPMIMQPLFKKVFNYSDKSYRQMLASRKEVILKLLFL